MEGKKSCGEGNVRKGTPLITEGIFWASPAWRETGSEEMKGWTFSLALTPSLSLSRQILALYSLFLTHSLSLSSNLALFSPYIPSSRLHLLFLIFSVSFCTLTVLSLFCSLFTFTFSHSFSFSTITPLSLFTFTMEFSSLTGDEDSYHPSW